MTDTEKSAFLAHCLALGAAASGVEEIGGRQFLVMPEGYAMTDVTEMIEKHLPMKPRKQGRITLKDASSFKAFVNEEKDDQTRVFYDPDTVRFVAQFNIGIGPNNAGWGDHLAIYACPHSTEWKTWVGSNKRVMKQAEFAQFIEDNLPDITAPASADMLEVSRSIEAKKNVDFKSATRLANGEVQFKYEETTEAKAGKGTLEIPERFEIGIPVFQGGQKFGIGARLRYRIDGSSLVMWYDLERFEKVKETVVEELAQDIAADVGLPVLAADMQGHR